ncbi:MAG: VWA domain-containing protein [Nannocystaceae bacterium]|nr:VWA domain-containing protein [Nannocystaceae bacterium]
MPSSASQVRMVSLDSIAWKLPGRLGHGVALLLALVPACADTRENPNGNLTTATTGPDPTTTTDPDTSSSTGGPPVLDLGVADLPSEECAGESVDAVAKLRGADVVMVVDNSSSMDYEMAEVQARLNGFAQAIIDDGIEVRVALLTAAAMGYYSADWVATPICIAAPLGSGMCSEAPDPGGIAPDSRDPDFMHVDHYVNSYNALPVIVEQHDNWGPFTDSDSALHFVIISDDDSLQPASYFIENFEMLEPNRAAIVHAVVPTSDCPEAASIGEQYIQLAQLTGGVVGDLCDQDFFEVFQVLVNAVQQESELPCTFDVPTPPEGEDFDPMQVNVEFDDGNGGGFEVGYVESAADCANVDNGWYYDDPAAPTSIIVCPQTCDAIQGHLGAKVQVVLGCATVPAG